MREGSISARGFFGEVFLGIQPRPPLPPLAIRPAPGCRACEVARPVVAAARHSHRGSSPLGERLEREGARGASREARPGWGPTKSPSCAPTKCSPSTKGSWWWWCGGRRRSARRARRRRSAPRRSARRRSAPRRRSARRGRVPPTKCRPRLTWTTLRLEPEPGELRALEGRGRGQRARDAALHVAGRVRWQAAARRIRPQRVRRARARGL